MNYLSRAKTITLLLFAFITSLSQAVRADYNTTSDEAFEKLLHQYKANPGLLREQPEALKALNEEQLVAAIESLGLDHFQYTHPVVLKGNQFTDLLGQKNDTLSIATVRNGKLIPVPYQIDDVDTAGWVYIEGESADEVDGTVGLLDKNDELVLMYRDTSNTPYSSDLVNVTGGEIIKELVFTDVNDQRRYAYLIKGATETSSTDYVSFDLATGQADTTFFNFRVDPKNILDFKDFKANVGEWQDRRLLDAVFFDIKTGVFTRWTNIELNNFDNFVGTPVAVVDGPVRAAVLLGITIKYGNIPIMKIAAQLNVFDQSLTLPLKIKIPAGEVLAKILVDPTLNIVLDFNGYENAHVVTTQVPEGEFQLVDGKMSKQEKAMSLTNEEPWFWMDSGRSWGIFGTAELEKTWPAKLDLAYLDDFDAKEKNETFDGASPRIGFSIGDWPTDKLDIRINIDLRFPDTVGKTGAHEFAKAVLSPPKAQIMDFEIN